MRTFHTGGIAGEDITHGLPRVVELFEARTPKGAAVLARTSGVVRITDEDNARRITIVGDDGVEDSYNVSNRAHLEVSEGQEVQAGDALVEGPKDPKQLLEIKGIRETQQYLVDEVQRVYREQGVSIHDKHIELIVRQMLRRVLVAEQGESPFLPGERVDSRIYAERMQFWSSETEEGGAAGTDDLAAWLASIGSSSGDGSTTGAEETAS